MHKKVIVFFNEEEPCVVDVAARTNVLRFQYPTGAEIELPIQKFQVRNNAWPEEYYIVTDREITNEEIADAISSLL